MSLPHTHTWSVVGRDSQFGRMVCYCPVCGAYEFYDNLQLQARGGLPFSPPPSKFGIEPPVDHPDAATLAGDPTTDALHATFGLLDDIEQAIRRESAMRATHVLFGQRIATIKNQVLREWQRRKYANRVHVEDDR
jgi:hypothetical protein